MHLLQVLGLARYVSKGLYSTFKLLSVIFSLCSPHLRLLISILLCVWTILFIQFIHICPLVYFLLLVLMLFLVNCLHLQIHQFVIMLFILTRSNTLLIVCHVLRSGLNNLVILMLRIFSFSGLFFKLLRPVILILLHQFMLVGRVFFWSCLIGSEINPEPWRIQFDYSL